MIKWILPATLIAVAVVAVPVIERANDSSTVKVRSAGRDVESEPAEYQESGVRPTTGSAGFPPLFDASVGENGIMELEELKRQAKFLIPIYGGSGEILGYAKVGDVFPTDPMTEAELSDREKTGLTLYDRDGIKVIGTAPKSTTERAPEQSPGDVTLDSDGKVVPIPSPPVSTPGGS
jgi:hypothetical protein